MIERAMKILEKVGKFQQRMKALKTEKLEADEDESYIEDESD